MDKSKLLLIKSKASQQSNNQKDRVLQSNLSITNVIEQEELIDEAISSSSGNAKRVWRCTQCNVNCLPIRLESRCMCSHRLKNHDYNDVKSKCKMSGCKCAKFFYIVAEGAWLLKCRCKHKTTEHDCSKAPYSCIKCRETGKSCRAFDSPFVCNCSCGWNKHVQILDNTDDRTSGSACPVRRDGLLAKELGYD